MWKDVPSFEGFYRVSDTGDVLSVGRTVESRRYASGSKIVRARLLIQYEDDGGYRQVTLYGSDRKSKPKVHQLVASAFFGPCPEGQEVRHLDGDPRNNCVWNLAYGTRQQNIADAIGHGTFTRGDRNGVAKLTNAQVARLKREMLDGHRTKDLAAAYGISPQAVSDIRAGRNWVHVEAA